MTLLLHLEETLLQSVIEYLLSRDSRALADTVRSLSLTCKTLSGLLRSENTNLWRCALKLRYGASPSQRQMNDAARVGFKTYFIRRVLLDRQWTRGEGQYRKSSLECHFASVTKLGFMFVQKHVDDDRVNADNSDAVHRTRSQWTPKQCLVTGSQDGHVVVWDLLTKETALSDVTLHEPYRVVSIQGNLGNNLMITADSGSELDGGDGAKIVGSDCFTGQKQFVIVRQVQHESEAVGPVSSAIAVAENLMVQACGNLLLVWKRHVGSKEFVQLHRLQPHDNHPIQCMIRSELTHDLWIEETQKVTKSHLCVVSGSLDGTIRCTDLPSGNSIFYVQHGSPVQFLSQCASTGAIIASSAYCMKVYDASGQLLASVDSDDHPITCMEISVDGRTIVTGSRDSTLSIFSLQLGASGTVSLTRTVVLGEVSRNSCTCLQFDNIRLAVGFQDGTIRVYSMSEQYEGEEPSLVTDITPHMGAITCIGFDLDCEYLAAGSKDTAITVLDYKPMHQYSVKSSDDAGSVLAVKLGIYDAHRQTYTGPPIETWRPSQRFAQDKEIAFEQILSGVFDNSFVLRNSMSEAECKHYIEQCERIGFEPCLGYNPRYRSNTRVIIEDGELAEELFERTRQYMPQIIVHQGEVWDIVGINPCLRFCKYIPGQHFSPHCDSSYYETEDTRSFLTWMIYMSGGFEKGATNFLSGRNGPCRTLAKVIPETGLLLVFPQETVLHEGEVLASGVKYLLRSDVLYKKRRTKQ